MNCIKCLKQCLASGKCSISISDNAYDNGDVIMMIVVGFSHVLG